MVANHTPGPWQAKEFTRHAQTTVISADGIVIAETTGFGRLADDCIADARLIAAAPELLEALKCVVRVADRATDEFDAARAAIAKATGSRQ